MKTYRLILVNLVVSFCAAAQPNDPVPFAPEIFPDGISGAVCGFSNDGRVIYFAKEDTVANQIHLFQATKTGHGWRDPALLSFSGKHSDLGGRLSKDGNTFYFTSDRPGGSAKSTDAWNIWTVVRSGNDWGQPKPLRELNDKGMECCPLPLEDGRLMFSADREPEKSWWVSVWDPAQESESVVPALNQEHAWQWPSSLNRPSDILFMNSMKRSDTQGMDDIYVSFHEGQQWTAPRNIGAPVNSKSYEDGAILSPDEEWLIFCRHETATTPSRVMCVNWKPVLAKLKR